MMTRTIRRKRLAATLILGVFLTACGGSRSEPATNTPVASETPAQSTPVRSPLTGFAKDLQDVKNGRFAYIWIFSRKDGKKLEPEDSIFLRTNAPQVVDWVLTDGGTRVIAGTNFNLEEGNLALLKKRFNAEDYTGK